jgi:MerR family transcriptional regulator, heat shock protein HspR
MKYYGITAVAHELRVHPSSLRRWEESEVIFPERVDMGRTTLRIYDEYTVQVLRLAKELMDEGMEFREAFDQAYYQIANQEDN